MIETTFGAGAAGCYPTSQASCIWYDISLIPSNCTDPRWQAQNYCSNTGGAAYNLPVQLSCQNQPTYTCKGPPGSTYGNSGFPTNCGNPNATCTGNAELRECLFPSDVRAAVEPVPTQCPVSRGLDATGHVPRGTIAPVEPVRRPDGAHSHPVPLAPPWDLPDLRGFRFSRREWRKHWP